VLVVQRLCSNTSMMLMISPSFDPIKGPPQATSKELEPHVTLWLFPVEVIVVKQVLVGQGQWICPADNSGIESVIGAAAVVGGAGAGAAVVGAAGAAVVGAAAAVVGAAAAVVVSLVPFCLCSFTSIAPGIVLHLTLLVTSVRLPAQSVIFLPLSRKAITFAPSIIRNCLLVPFLVLITNFCPILHPVFDILSIIQRSTYSQWYPIRLLARAPFLICLFGVCFMDFLDFFPFFTLLCFAFFF